MVDTSATSAPVTRLKGVSFDRIWLGLRIALDILVIVLLVVAVAPNPQWQEVVVGAVFFLLYLAGSVGPIGRARTSSASGEVAVTQRSALVIAWLVALLSAWAVLAMATIDASFLIFALFFVIMQATGGIIAVILVACATAAAIATIAVHAPLTFGSVLGPVLGGSFALTVGLGFRVLQRETIAKSRALQELSDARAESEALSRRAGELGERARLAADIHDTVAQGLSSIQLLLHSAEARLDTDATDPAALSSLRLARTVAADNLAETRRIIAALQPAPLADADLPAALAKVSSTTVLGDAISFHVDGHPTALPADVEATLVRAAQGSLSNVVKHSGATLARVTLTYQPDAILLDVVDNGRGFDVTAPVAGDSVGIATMQRRIEALGGVVTIESARGEGCGISISIPLH